MNTIIALALACILAPSVAMLHRRDIFIVFTIEQSIVREYCAYSLTLHSLLDLVIVVSYIDGKEVES